MQVPRLDSLRASGPLALARMITKCGPQIFACVNDPECKAALDCLQSCSPTDQARMFPCVMCMLPQAVHLAVKSMVIWEKSRAEAQAVNEGTGVLLVPRCCLPYEDEVRPPILYISGSV